MKRANDDHQLARRNDSSSPFPGPSQPMQPQAKRQKASHACSSCRKHKTRCEQIEGYTTGSQRCHRCNVLNMQCSFDNAQLPTIQVTSTAPKESPERQIMLDFNSPPDSPRTAAQIMKPEDLVPAPITPWTSHKGLGRFDHDWMATPMLALQELARRPNSTQQQLYVNQASLSLIDIITPDQLLYLLEIFDSRFSPWLEIPSIQDAHTPLLDLVRCNIASRHLDIVTRSVVAPRLQKLTEEAVFKEIFNPVPSTEAIHAIIILSFWSPLPCTPQYDIRDGRLLAASAVSMAMNLRLSQASELVASLQGRKKMESGLSAANAQDLMEATIKARLWICLSNVESTLCVGTGRQPLSHHSDSDQTFIDSCISDVESGRELRLGLMAQLLDLTERGYRIHFVRYSEMDKWHKEVLDVLVKLEGLHRMMLPLSAVAEQDMFQYRMLLFYYHFCRLLVFHQALREARRVLQEQYPGRPWHKEFVHQGNNLALIWGQESMSTAEAVLVVYLSRPENITSAPDIVFTMVSFATVWLIIAKFARYQARGEHLPGASDGLITKVIERLSQSALTPEHTPAKCAQVVNASFKAYAKCTTMSSADSQEDARTRVGHAVSAERMSKHAQAAVPHTTGSGAAAEATHGPDILNYDFNPFMNSEIFLDTTFWSSFMDNLSAGSL